MKIVALIASYDREMVLRDCLNAVMPQVDDVVLVGTSTSPSPALFKRRDAELKIAEELNLLYVDYSNSILGRKWQAGLNRCRELRPDAVLIVGSDDIIQTDHVQMIVGENEVLECVHGPMDWYMYNPKLNKLAKCSYQVRIDPIGAGRVLPATALDKVDWQIFPTEGGVGCDVYSYNILSPHVTFVACQPILSIKGNWAMMDTWEQIVGATSLNVTIYEDDIRDKVLKGVFCHIDFEKYKQ